MAALWWLDAILARSSEWGGARALPARTIDEIPPEEARVTVTRQVDRPRIDAVAARSLRSAPWFSNLLWTGRHWR
ncbi:MAG TPA: hypothetical protein VG248_12760 [Caulobacteraceae bacterium]|jgi:hypothetical protein|nr:hypothetical protein [Caulobacteraceae bacterium]